MDLALDYFAFDTMTIVDSEQSMLRSGIPSISPDIWPSIGEWECLAILLNGSCG
jgi:hypothetical protein